MIFPEPLLVQIIDSENEGGGVSPPNTVVVFQHTEQLMVLIKYFNVP